jgi:hypothetical protein
LGACSTGPFLISGVNMSWSKGYFTDSGYTYGFYPQLTPLSIYWASLIKGHILPIEKFRYIDLGCGQGYSLIMNAINHPDAEFVGFDLMPEHIQHATDLSTRLGLENIKFYEFDFLDGDYENLKISKFNYVIAHGITTWVNLEVRHALSKIVDKAIKIGGVFHNSYNTPYFWQQLISFQHLARTFSLNNDGSSAINKAVKYYEFVNQLVPDFLDSNPYLRDKLKTFKTQSKDYLIHEYCNQNWRLVFFSDEYEINSKIKLNYLGSMNLTEEFDEHLPKELLDEIKTENWLTQKIMKDTFLSTSFKHDLWIKGRPQDVSSAILTEINRLIIYPHWQQPFFDLTQPIKIKSGPIEIHTKNKLAQYILNNSKQCGLELNNILNFNEDLDEILRIISILIDSKYISIGFEKCNKSNSNILKIILSEIAEGKPYNFVPAGNIASAVDLDTIGLIMLAASINISNKSEILDSTIEILKKRKNKVYSEDEEILGSSLYDYLSKFYDKKFIEIKNKLSVLGAI